jgi:hypothetical protein
LFRGLLNALTIGCALLLAGVLVLRHRSAGRVDTLVLRTAPSYTAWPPLKWVVVRGGDALLFGFETRITPAVDAQNVVWRDDVPPGTTAPAADGPDPVELTPAVPPSWPSARPITPGELRGYEARVARRYAGAPLLTWELADANGAIRAPPGPMLTGYGIVSAAPFGEFVRYNNGPHSGAYRETRLRVPFPVAAAVLVVPPTALLSLALFRWVRRRRVPRGLCTHCGYDLRASPHTCPECGQPTAARRPVPESRPRTAIRWLVAAGPTAGLVLIIVLGWHVVARVTMPVLPDRAPDPAVRDRARAAVESLRVTVAPPPPPLRETVKRPYETDPSAYPAPGARKRFGDAPAAVDPVTGFVYFPGFPRYGVPDGLLRLDPATGQQSPVAVDPAHAPLFCAALAFDPHRRRLMVLAGDGPAAHLFVYLYAPDTGRWSAAPRIRFTWAESLAWSESDDCFYALCRTRVGNFEVESILRLSPDGREAWRVPVFEPVTAAPSRFHDSRLQIAAAGPFVVILTPPMAHASNPGAPAERRCIVIDPKSNTIVDRCALPPGTFQSMDRTSS